MISNKGNSIANQFLIYANNGVYFQSYNSIIALKKNDGTIVLSEKYWDYSKTTSKYRNIFLGETSEQTKYQIKIGNYKLQKLN
jgi:hypothetical protein